MHFTLPHALIRMLYQRQMRNADPQLQQFAISLASTLPEHDQVCLEKLGEMRQTLGTDSSKITFEDFGLSNSDDSEPSSVFKTKTVQEIYSRASIPKTWSEFLFRLVRHFEPEHVLELGTNLGVGSAYIQSGLDLNGKGRLSTLEGSAELSSFARKLVSGRCDGEADFLVGPFSRSLVDFLDKKPALSLVFIDGHHTEEATIRYYEMIRPYLTNKALVIFDDTEPWSPVKKAWDHIKKSEKMSRPNVNSIYLLKKGLLYFPQKK